VTHDQEEAFEVADKVVVMRGGRVEQAGTPQEVFEHPANGFVIDFLGNVNVFHGRVENGLFRTAVENVDGEIAGSLEVAFPGYPHEDSRPATVYIRPHELDISHTPQGSSNLEARILHINPTGSVTRVQLLAVYDNMPLTVELSKTRYAELNLQAGEIVFVSPQRVRVYESDYVI
jgi:sulfate transport system ATP-binding protein